ncbi:MAG: hypothetical protein ABIS39_06770 [Sphingomicrobium sp.]
MSGAMFLAMMLSTAAPTEAQLSTRAGGEDIIPAYFQGTWGQSLKACADAEGTGKIIIGPTRIEGYELDARLLKIGLTHSATAPDGEVSHHADLLLAESGEGHVGIETYVISRVKEKLYLSGNKGSKNLMAAQQYANPNILCPAPAK